MVDLDNLIFGVGNEVVATTLGVIMLLGVVLVVSPEIFTVPYRHIANWISNLFPARIVDQEDGQVNQRDRSPHGERGTRDPCAICLADPLRLGLETNCGHIYCGSCILTCWEVGIFPSCMNCPLCRQQVRMLFLSFTPEEQASDELENDRHDIIYHATVYNRRYCGMRRSWGSYLTDWPILMRHLWREFFSGGLAFMFCMRIVMCFIGGLLYLFWPLDIIPEAIFGTVGLLDDLFIICLLAIYMTIIYRRAVVLRGQYLEHNLAAAIDE